jgi:glycosyltransferase involved in cell wall biosynthesis
MSQDRVVHGVHRHATRGKEMPPLVTVAVPTRCRADLIADCIQSILSQTMVDFELLIIDTSPDRRTEAVALAYADSRLNYARASNSLSVIEAWNRCVEIASGGNILILGDDDRLHPSFLAKSLEAMKSSDDIGFTFTHANKTDLKWTVQRLWGYEFPREGHLSSADYLAFTLEHECCISLASTVLVRKQVYDSVGLYRAEFGANTFDFNFYLRAARRFSAYFLPEVLVDYRLHPAQLTELHWRTPVSPTGKISTYLELLGLAATLMRDQAVLDTSFLADRAFSITKHLADLLATLYTTL